MTPDEIKALIERLREDAGFDGQKLLAADALTDLSDQLAAKTELVTLLRASLAKSEGEVEGLKVNSTLMVELASCSRADPNGKKPWNLARRWITVNVPGELMDRIHAAIDAARAQGKEGS